MLRQTSKNYVIVVFSAEYGIQMCEPEIIIIVLAS